MLAVVHQPTVVAFNHHVPSISLRRTLEVMALPLGVAYQTLQSVIPVVSPNACHTHHIHGVANSTQTGNGGFGANDIVARRFEGVWVERCELGVRGARQIFGHDQAIVQHHKRVVGFMDGQQIGLEHTALTV